MPDDDYAKAQSAHAQKMRAERAVMDLTGASRSQIRKALGAFAAARLSRKEDEPEKKESVPIRPVPVLPGPETKFEPKPFTLEERHAAPLMHHVVSPAWDPPYVLGTDSTTADPDPRDDDWDRESPPADTVGVSGTVLTRVYKEPVDSTHERVYIYGLNFLFDDQGGLVTLSEEFEATSFIAPL